MKYAVIAVVLVAAALAVTFRRVYVLRADDCQSLDARPVNGGLAVRGVILHSNLGVDHVTTQRAGDRMIVRAYLIPGGDSAKREFAVSIRVPDDVREVWFGDPPGTSTCCSLAGRVVHLPVAAESSGRLLWRRNAVAR